MPKLQKTIADFISDRSPPTVDIGDTVAAAVAEVSARKADCVLVLDGDRVAGIFTERDFLNRVAGESRNPKATPIKDVMTAGVETLTSGDCISYAINRMAVGGYRNVPIVDDGKPVAVLGIRDVIGHLFELFVDVSDRESTEVTPWTDIGGG